MKPLFHSIRLPRWGGGSLDEAGLSPTSGGSGAEAHPEENFRRLLGAAYAGAEASSAFQERVAAALEAEAASGRRLPERPRMTVTRRALLLGGPAVAAAAALLLTMETPAQALQKTLLEMAQVRSAYASGSFVSYGELNPDTGQPYPGRMQVRYWYRAPDYFRRNMGPKIPGWAVVPGEVFMHGEKGVFVDRWHPERPVRRPLSSSSGDGLGSFHYFSHGGFLSQALQKRGVRITRSEGVLDAKPVAVFTVDWVRQRVPPHWIRSRWTLFVDPGSRRIIRAEFGEEWQENGAWVPAFEEILDQFEYDVEVRPVFP